MKRTQAEIKEIAKAIFNSIMADMQYDFPAVAKAANKADAKKWAEFCDEQEGHVSEILLTKFDYLD